MQLLTANLLLDALLLVPHSYLGNEKAGLLYFDIIRLGK